MKVHWIQGLIALTLTVYVAAFAIALAVTRRQTGANPWGHARGHPRVQMLGSLATALLLTTGVAYVIDARSLDRFVRIRWLDRAPVRVLGVAACTLATLLLIWGEASLGRAFRVALPEHKERLVTRGIYRWVRNPLALSVDLLSLGILSLAPSLVAVAGFALTVVAYELKIRAEERYLREAHGPAYADYCARTGRYIPRLVREG